MKRLLALLISLVPSFVLPCFGEGGHVATEANGKTPIITLQTSKATVEVSLWGARILSLKIRGDEVLWRPRKWRLDGGAWAHGGIPLCWPWFGSAGPDPKIKHGFAHARKFSVRHKHETKERCELVLGLSADDGTRRLWPHEFDLEYKITLTDRLRLELKTVNTGQETFRFTTGFHPFFAIGERDRTLVTGTDGMRFCDSRVTMVFDGVWKGDMPLLSSFDHVFEEKGPTAFHAIEDTARGRRIELTSGGASRLVVWNPGSEEPMEENPAPGRLAVDDWRRMICVEPAILWNEAARSVAPGASYVLWAEIALAPSASSGSVPKHFKPSAGSVPISKPSAGSVPKHFKPSAGSVPISKPSAGSVPKHFKPSAGSVPISAGSVPKHFSIGGL